MVMVMAMAASGLFHSASSSSIFLLPFLQPHCRLASRIRFKSLIRLSSSARISSLHRASPAATAAPDLSEYLLAKQDWRKTPSCPDFIGPVCIKHTPDGRGRGVFATRYIPKGELIMIGNPIASSHNDTDCVELFARVCNVLKQNPWACHRFFLLAGCEERPEVPPVELFDPNFPFADSVDHISFDYQHVYDIMRLNSFQAKLYSDGHPTIKVSGMYLLPAMMNHSCTRNASRLFVGEAMVFYAARDIQQNEEITVEYADGLLPLKMRELLLGTRFQCRCLRCQVERSVEKHLAEYSTRFVVFYAQAYEELREMLTTGKETSFRACKQLATAFDGVREKTVSFGHLTKLEKQWILAGFSSAFLANWFRLGQSSGFSQSSQHVTPVALELLDAMMVTVPGVEHTLSFAMLLSIAAQQGDFQLSGRLLNIAKDECVATYGKQRADVITALTLRAAQRAPF